MGSEVEVVRVWMWRVQPSSVGWVGWGKVRRSVGWGRGMVGVWVYLGWRVWGFGYICGYMSKRVV